VPIVSDLPACDENLSATFSRWQIVLGEGILKRGTQNNRNRRANGRVATRQAENALDILSIGSVTLCNLYNVTTNQDAIGAFTRAIRDVEASAVSFNVLVGGDVVEVAQSNACQY